MTYTHLIEEKMIKPRTKFNVEIKVESENEALECAKALRKMAHGDINVSCNWALNLADIFEGK